MPQTSNIRLLLLSSSANRHPLFAAKSLSSSLTLFRTPTKHKPHFLLTCSSSSRYHSNSKNNRNNTNYSRVFKRAETTLPEAAVKKKKDLSNTDSSKPLPPMKNSDITSGFNRKRAEGRDANDRPKKLHLKSRKLNPTNTTAYVQILGTGMDTQDTSPSVLLFFDKQRFIFNAGEGLQRFCSEHKIKLSKIDHIFLSRVCSETAGGLPGLLLTLAGMGDEGMSVNMWGSSDLEHLVNAMKSFIPNAAMVHTHCFGPNPGLGGCSSGTSMKLDDLLVLHEDEVVKISAVLLRPKTFEASESIEETDLVSNDSKSEKMHQRGDHSVVYICELPEIIGTFYPEKAMALGLKPGRKYGELQHGHSVETDGPEKFMVHPADVMDPSIPGPIVVLVDCPTLMHLQELLSLQCFTPYYIDAAHDAPENLKIVTCMIHLSPTNVTKTNDYQIWMSRFGNAQHIMAGHEKRNIEVPILKSSARIATRLNYLCPQFFPSPGFWSMKHLNSLQSDSEASEISMSKTTDLIAAENLLKFQMRPHVRLDRSNIPNLSSRSEIIDELLSEIPEVVDASKQVNQFWLGTGENSGAKPLIVAERTMTEEPWLHESEIPRCLEDISREDMEMVLLGTGSSQPSKYRNVTSIFINLFSKGSLLLDCGEGTLGQLKRRFGVEGADKAVKGLRCIWISHIHADHHTGLARILALRRDLLKGLPHEPIIVVGPSQLKRFLDAYQKLEDLDMQFLDCLQTSEASWEALESDADSDTQTLVNESVDSSLFARGNRMQSFWMRPGSPTQNGAAIPIVKSLKKVLIEAGIESLISFQVVHCRHAFGVVLKAANRINRVGKSIPGWKFVYSGDTRPCPELVKASRGATVLIHEATFEDALLDEAIARNHSTTQEAIDVGNSAEVYRIILTHFSQRYPKIPVFDESHMHKTCIAFDLMSVNLADVHVLPRVLPHLKLLFKDEMVVDQSEDVDLATAVAL